MKSLLVKILGIVFAFGLAVQFFVKDRLMQNEFLYKGQQLDSAKGCFRLAMQHD